MPIDKLISQKRKTPQIIGGAHLTPLKAVAKGEQDWEEKAEGIQIRVRVSYPVDLDSRTRVVRVDGQTYTVTPESLNPADIAAQGEVP